MISLCLRDRHRDEAGSPLVRIRISLQHHQRYILACLHDPFSASEVLDVANLEPFTSSNDSGDDHSAHESGILGWTVLINRGDIECPTLMTIFAGPAGCSLVFG